MSDLDKINSIFNAKIDTVKTKEDLQNIKTEFFGKNGKIKYMKFFNSTNVADFIINKTLNTESKKKYFWHN